MTTKIQENDWKRENRPLYPSLNMKDKYALYDIKKIGYLDIETSGLTANFDIMLSYGILVRDTQTEKTEIRSCLCKSSDFALAQKKENADLIDKRITEKLILDLVGIDCLIGHWFIGKHRHDIPFVRTRVAINKIKGFPKHKQVRYGDTQRWGSALFRNHNNSLETLAAMFDVHTHKTRLDAKIWKNACIGVKSALEYVYVHNIRDCKITYKIHKGLEDLVPVPSIYY